ncbi:MAG: T9SS type A sorting domain-containing protein [Bacteroidetes bacterium]|nr:T9SS type A sorting domain-containing protein [Bacteroidota bacterium]
MLRLCSRTHAVLLGAALSWAGPTFSQFGPLDPGFDPGVGTGAGSTLTSIALQPDGKVLIGGTFTQYRSVARRGIARLNGDGTLDTSFDPGADFNSATVDHILPLPDGKVLICGELSFLNGTMRRGVARLNSDGSRDTGFDAGADFGSYAPRAVVQPDGKVIVPGFSFAGDGTTTVHLARLAGDGSVDTTFHPGAGFDDIPLGLALQPDGKIMVHGMFQAFNGVPCGRIARLNSDGSLDNSFHPGTGFAGDINAMALQPDGRILVAGVLDSLDGVPCGRIVRLNSNGDRDVSFHSDPASDLVVFGLGLQQSGEVIIVGTRYLQGASTGLVRKLASDGTVLPAFDAGAFSNGPFSVAVVYACAVQPDDKVLLAGMFSSVGGTSRRNVARLMNCPGVTWYADHDGDGYGDANTTMVSCTRPPGYVADAADCNDASAEVAPSGPCDDGDPATINDMFTEGCICAGQYTQLTNIPAPIVSCGASNLQFGSSMVYALEVPGANRYEFNFTNTPNWPSYNRFISYTSRSFLLTAWATLPLKSGRTYNVKVRASFDNGATWSPWGASCIIHVGYAGQAREERVQFVEEAGDGITLWPNPNAGDRFQVALDAVEEGRPVGVHVVDPAGRLVIDRSYPAAPVLSVELPEGLSPGMYMVRITTGDRSVMQRLVIG